MIQPVSFFLFFQWVCCFLFLFFLFFFLLSLFIVQGRSWNIRGLWPVLCSEATHRPCQSSTIVYFSKLELCCRRVVVAKQHATQHLVFSPVECADVSASPLPAHCLWRTPQVLESHQSPGDCTARRGDVTCGAFLGGLYNKTDFPQKMSGSQFGN